MMNTQEQKKQLDLSRVFDALRRPLDLIDNPERRADFDRFVDAAKVHQERAIFDLVSDIATAINESGTSARVRLEYANGNLSVVTEEARMPDGAAESVFGEDDDIERVTIRLPARLKAMIDEAAGRSGTSVNSWYVRALSHAVVLPFMRRGFEGMAPGPWMHRGGRGRGGRGGGRGFPGEQPRDAD